MNGWGKQLLVGVAILVLAAVIIGSGGATISNTVARAGTEVTVKELKDDVAENTKRTEGIDVMQKQVDIIEKNVGKILDKLDE